MTRGKWVAHPGQTPGTADAAANWMPASDLVEARRLDFKAHVRGSGKPIRAKNGSMYKNYLYTE